ncbi:Fic family protein [Candidatus Poriferisodalis sp.]|uniref:Fic family protein n=1 Tax=Candidatus Poriferisodalis sp. TaxID=3101277 RepID=UPI003AF5DFE0
MEDVAEGTAGRTTEVEWRGRTTKAWVPQELRRRDLALPATVVRSAERAVAALRLADQRLPASWEALARLLLRHEGIASSGIEGLREPASSVLVAERTGSGGAAGWIADNLAVIDMALLSAKQPLNVEVLHSWHARLMRYSGLAAEMVGAFRPSLGWVGGTSPLDAAYVPPPPDEINRLMDDLLRFADASDDLDAVSRAAIAHAQFEAIHPYGDGNGRLGRVLVSRILRRADATQRSVAPISMAAARDPGGYLSGLRLFETGQTARWVQWFAQIVERAAGHTDSIVEQSQQLIEQWTEATSTLRHDSAARALLQCLPGHPVINSADVAELLGVSERTGRTALESLAERGVLQPIQADTGHVGRARRWYAAADLLRLWGT